MTSFMATQNIEGRSVHISVVINLWRQVLALLCGFVKFVFAGIYCTFLTLGGPQAGNNGNYQGFH